MNRDRLDACFCLSVETYKAKMIGINGVEYIANQKSAVQRYAEAFPLP